MSRIFIDGSGAVTPAGWGIDALLQALRDGGRATTTTIPRPGWDKDLRLHAVPAPTPPLAFLKHPRLRRTSHITQYALAAAREALGPEEGRSGDRAGRLGIIFCTLTGCVNYSRRFYDEVLQDPATASPLVFPETVFNAPASHLATYFQTAVDYTLVGDPGVFLQGLALAAQWLDQGMVASCLVVGAEEKDWLTADAVRLFRRNLVSSEGAGALFLTRKPSSELAVVLDAITDICPFHDRPSRRRACESVRDQLPGGTESDLLCDGRRNVPGRDEVEQQVWANWRGSRVSLKSMLGEGFTAATAWQCVAAAELIRRKEHRGAWISVPGFSEHAIGARFTSAAQPEPQAGLDHPELLRSPSERR